MRSTTRLLVTLTVLLTFAWALAGPAAARPKRAKKVEAPPPVDAALELQLWQILESGTRSGDIPARGLALDALCWLRPAESIKYAVDALKDPQWLVRAGVIRALLRRSHPDAVPALRHEMTRGRADVARQIMPLLELLPEKEAVALLQDVLADPNVGHRRAIIDGVANAGGPVAAALWRASVGKGGKVDPVVRDAVARLRERHLPLLAISAESPAGEIQSRVLEAAATLPKELPRDFLRPLLKASDPELRLGAAEQLAASGDASALPLLLGQLNDPDGELAVRALRALAGTPTPEARKAAREKMENTERLPAAHFSAVLDGTLSVFAAAGDDSLLSLMHGFLTGTDAALRTVVVRHLGKAQGPRALPTLHDLLFDGNPAVRKGAACAIGDAAQSESIPALQRALDDRDPEVRRASARALARIHDKAVVDVVSFLVSDPDEQVRRAATEALFGARHSSALLSLRTAMSDRDPAIRLVAYRGLVALAPDEARGEWPGVLNWLEPEQLTAMTREFGADFLPFLERALESPRPEIREGAVLASGLLGLADRLGMLGRVVLEHPMVDVRVAALEQLAAEQGASAYPLVRDLTRDGDPAVRRAALAAMARVGSRPEAVDDARAFLVDQDEAIRITAAATITTLLHR